MIVLSKNATFLAPVKLSRINADPVEVHFVFRAISIKRTVALLRLSTLDKKAGWFRRAFAYLQLCWRVKRLANVVDMFDEIIESWEGFDVPYSREALRMLFAEFPGASVDIFFSFIENYREARLKN